VNGPGLQGRPIIEEKTAMTDAIEFLEQLGQNAATAIDPELRSALLAADTLRLGELLGAQPNICCLIEKPDQEEDEEEEEEEEDDEAVRLD
jgi:hypothetical protein